MVVGAPRGIGRGTINQPPINQVPIQVAAVGPDVKPAGNGNGRVGTEQVIKALKSLQALPTVRRVEVETQADIKTGLKQFIVNVVLKERPKSTDEFQNSIVDQIKKSFDPSLDVKFILDRVQLLVSIEGITRSDADALQKEMLSQKLFAVVYVDKVEKGAIKLQGNMIWFVSPDSPDVYTRFFDDKKPRKFTPRGKFLLRAIANYLVEKYGTRLVYKLEIQSHSRNYKRTRWDEKLTEDRAMMVKTELINYLRDRGVQINPSNPQKTGDEDVFFNTKGYGTTRPIVPNSSPDAYQNNRVEIFVKESELIAAAAAPAKTPEGQGSTTAAAGAQTDQATTGTAAVDQGTTGTATTDQGTSGVSGSPGVTDSNAGWPGDAAASGGQGDVVVTAAPERALWKKIVPSQASIKVSTRLDVLWAEGPSDNGFAPGGQLDLNFGWPVYNKGDHTLVIGAILGAGLTAPRNPASGDSVYACYPETANENGVSGCISGEPNKRFSLGMGAHVGTGLAITYTVPLLGGRFYGSAVGQYLWSRYDIEDHSSREPVHTDLAATDDFMVQHQLAAGIDLALTYKISEVPMFSEVGPFIKVTAPLYAIVQDGPSNMHFPYLGSAPSVFVGLAVGSFDLFNLGQKESEQ